MSKQILHIELDPPEQQREEVIYAENFKCPACNGCGYNPCHSRQKNETRNETCGQCEGTKRLKATVYVEWKPQYD